MVFPLQEIKLLKKEINFMYIQTDNIQGIFLLLHVHNKFEYIMHTDNIKIIS